MGEWMYRSTFSWTRSLYPPGTHWIQGWVGPRAGLDNVENEKFLTLLGLEIRPLCCPAKVAQLVYLYESCVCNFITSCIMFELCFNYLHETESSGELYSCSAGQHIPSLLCNLNISWLDLIWRQMNPVRILCFLKSILILSYLPSFPSWSLPFKIFCLQLCYPVWPGARYSPTWQSRSVGCSISGTGSLKLVFELSDLISL
jgi:hypothetical protein